MNFIRSILKHNYRRSFYEALEDDDDNDVDFTKAIQVVDVDKKPSTYYHITTTPNCAEAVPFGLPHNRRWFLYRSRKHQSGYFYKKAEIASILRVLLFDLCGLSARNIDKCIENCDNKIPPYTRDSFRNFYKRPVKSPWFDEISLHRLTVDLDGRYYKLKNVHNEFNDDLDVMLAPEVEIECERSFNSALNGHLTRNLFYRYLQQLLGPKVPRIIQVPMEAVFRNNQMSFDFYKHVHKDIEYLFLEVCPTIHDFLVFKDFFRHFDPQVAHQHHN